MGFSFSRVALFSLGSFGVGLLTFCRRAETWSGGVVAVSSIVGGCPVSLCIFLPGTAVGWFFRFPSCLVFYGVCSSLIVDLVVLFFFSFFPGL